MPTEEAFKAAEPVLQAIIAEPFDQDRTSTLVGEYIAGEPANAVALQVIMVYNMADRIRLEAPPQDGMRVELVHQMFHAETKERMESEDMEFVLHLVEHRINGETDAVYDHLIELITDQRQFLSIVAASVALYRRLTLLDENDKHARLRSIVIDDDGVTELTDIGNPDIQGV